MTSEKTIAYNKKWRADNPERVLEHNRKWKKNNPGYVKANLEWRRREGFGSVERYEEAMLKYDGWCAFACDKKAELVHHLDGKSINNSRKEDIDNSLKNLLPLCRICHSKLHTWKRTMKHLREKKENNGRKAIEEIERLIPTTSGKARQALLLAIEALGEYKP